MAQCMEFGMNLKDKVVTLNYTQPRYIMKFAWEKPKIPYTVPRVNVMRTK